MSVVRCPGGGRGLAESGRTKRRDHKRENFPGLTVSYREPVEY